MHRRADSLLARLTSILLPVALTVALSAVAGAQQPPPSRFVRSADVAATAPVSRVVARDSAARYLRAARAGRSTGGALVTAGIGGLMAAYVQFVRSGRMGMNGGQTALFAAGTGVGALGLSRWAASRESYRTAARWAAVADAADR